MIRLAVDTSTTTQTVALEIDETLVATRRLERRRGHSESLLGTVEGLLSDAGISIDAVDEIICGLGPGSFTGVRIGLSFALGIAAARNIPLFGVDSMRAFLAFLPSNLPAAVAIDARKSEVYGVVYRADRERTEEHVTATCPPAEFFEHVAQRQRDGIVYVGNAPEAFDAAWSEYAEDIVRIDTLSVPLAEGLIYAHARGWSRAHDEHPLEPRYIRPSDAEKSR